MVEVNATDLIVHEEIFYQSAEFWVGIAFVFALAISFSSVVKLIKSIINKRIQRIKKELQDAETLKIDAQKLYAEYERKFQNMDKEIAEIIANQQEVITQTKAQKMREFEHLLKQKETDTTAKINYAYTQAKTEISKKVIEKAINIISTAIPAKLDKKDYDNLITQSISNIEKCSLGLNEEQ